MGKKTITLFSGKMRQYFPTSRRDMLMIFYGAITVFAGLIISNFEDIRNWRTNNTIPTPMEEFPEPAWRTDNTLGYKTLTSTPFARFEIHRVRTESGAIINDWLWTDERSHVNILVHLKNENKYIMFYQKKYGLEKNYFATVGGLFNLGETGEQCARRELLEETGLETNELIGLGKYRVQVNRGGGILYAYYARNCVPSKTKKVSDDYENQEKKKVSRKELIEIVLSGNVGEAQWVATVALALLFEDYQHHMTKHRLIENNATVVQKIR